VTLTTAPDFTDGPITAAKLQQLSDAINDRTPIFSQCTTDQTVTSSTTLVNSAIVLPVKASRVYAGYLAAVYGAVQAADIKFAWAVPGSTTIQRKNVLYAEATSSTNAATGELIVMRQRAATTEQIVSGKIDTNFDDYFEFLKINADTDGNCVLQFAQNTSNATGSILRAQTYAIIWLVD